MASVLPLLGLTSQAQSSITNGLVAYWNFDKNNFKDSVGIFDGTQNGSNPIAFAPGKTGFGQAMVLDGTDQMVEITGGGEDDLAFQGGSMSVAGWFKVGTFDKSWQALVAKGEGTNWRVHRRGGGVSMSYAGGIGEGADDSPDVTDGNWHHFVAMSDTTGANFGTALYIDGTQSSVNAGAPNLNANGKRVMIGENPDARNRYWNGLVDDIALWNRVLTTAEISALYANGTGKAVSSFFAAELDTDKDGIPDSWEIRYGLNPKDPSDAAKDNNGNGLSNLDEYKLGLDPNDTTKPTVLSAASTGTFDTLKLTFSTDLDPVTAINKANYTISPNLAVTDATYKNKVVTLTTAKQTPDTAYTVTVKGVKNPSRFEVPAGSTLPFYSYVMLRTGVLKFAYWGGINGTPVDNLLSDPRYPASPDLVMAVFSFNSRDAFPDDSHENYGATIEGFLTPTESASYDFFLRSDDASQLYLSTDDKEANLQLIAEETGCCKAFLEPGAPTTTATPIALTSGKKYFVRVIYKEGGGGDFAQVAWRKTTDKTPAGSLTPIPGKYLSAAVGLPAPAEGGFVTQTPAPNDKNASPVPQVTIAHRDGKTAWTAANLTLKFDGAAVTPTITKDGNVATILYKGSGLLASQSTHTITLGYPDPSGKPATVEWSFQASLYKGPTLDKLHQFAGLIKGKADLTTDGGGFSGKPGDRAIDLGKGGGQQSVLIPDASFINAATAVADELTFSIWVKKYDNADSSAFWADSPSSRGTQRGFQAHTPWSNNNVYFDTAGCCDGSLERIQAGIDTFPDYTGDISWWTNKWHHFAFSKKGPNKQIWIDGKLFLEGQNTNPLPSDFAEIWLGAEGGGPNAGTSHNMHGLLDDFSVFATALSAADIGKLASGSLPTSLAASTKILAYWDFNEVSAPSSPDTITNGLVAYWNFDGNLLDSIKSLHGTSRGTTPVGFVDGKGGFGKALQLNGTNSVEITGSATNLQFAKGSVSIGGWFKVDAFDKSWQALISKGENSNYRIARRGDGKTIAYAGGVGEGPDDVPAVNDGNWHHFVAVTDATGAKFGTALYLDGVIHGVNTNKAVLEAGTLNLMIGENPGALKRQWKGAIDDIAIWNRVLTSDEVSLLYKGGAGMPISTVPGVNAAIGVAITRSGNNVTIGWSPAGGTLESKSSIDPAAPWTAVGTANPATITIGAGSGYYRVRK